MVEHYYTEKPSTTSEPRSWQTKILGFAFDFITDRGVFSKNEIDFGSRLLIETFTLPQIDGPILDVGCGYGPIGLSIAKAFPERHVVMVDINERAVRLSQKNAALNTVHNVQIYQSDLFEKVDGTYAAILTNPPIRAGKDTVYRIFEEAYKSLKHKGQLWVVIQKKQGAPSAMKKLESLFQHVDVVSKKKGYYIMSVTKS